MMILCHAFYLGHWFGKFKRVVILTRNRTKAYIQVLSPSAPGILLTKKTNNFEEYCLTMVKM